MMLYSIYNFFKEFSVMKEFPNTITTENFSDVAKLTSKLIAKSKKKALIRKIIKPVGGILFLLLSFLLVYGAIFS